MLSRRRFLPLLIALGVLLFTSLASADEADQFAQALAKGPVYAGLAAFGSGLLVSLTPCVYPMVAVTVSVFGARQVSSRFQGAMLSAAFVAGIVAMFVPLGVVAGLTGSLAGAVLQNQWVVIGISTLFLIMAASMFGAFELDLPSGLKNRLAQVGGAGYMGAFVLGLACGPIAAPCTGPFLTGILAWITKTQSATMGGLAMGAFALGLGVPFFVVGAFAIQLPKSGAWMVHIKSALGLILVIVALYFLNTVFPSLGSIARPTPTFLAITGAIAIGGLLAGAVHKSFDGGTADKVRKGIGIAATSVSAFLFVVGMTIPEQTLTWEKIPLQAAKVRAASQRKPLLVDFTAAWCGACKELDKLTFSAELVRREAGRFVAVKVDATEDDDPMVESTLEEHDVVGLPTVVLYDSSGAEAMRYTDFVGPEQFLSALQKVN